MIDIRVLFIFDRLSTCHLYVLHVSLHQISSNVLQTYSVLKVRII